MGKGKGHNLPGIRRVCHNLLIAGHGGVKAQFCHGLAGGAKAVTVKQGSILHRQTCCRRWGGRFCHAATLLGMNWAQPSSMGDEGQAHFI